MLHIGPAMAILSSVPGSFGSSDMWAIPPKTNKVIPFIGILFLMAMKEWDSSCKSRDANKNTAEMIAINQ